MTFRFLTIEPHSLLMGEGLHISTKQNRESDALPTELLALFLEQKTFYRQTEFNWISTLIVVVSKGSTSGIDTNRFPPEAVRRSLRL